MSIPSEPTLLEFETLCANTCRFMNEKAKNEPDYYLSKGAQKLEPEVKKALDKAADRTAFAGTIEIVSGQRFPDIVVAKRYGVEVKSTKEDKWSMIGGSVAEGTRIDGIEYVHILFGKLHKPVEFMTRRYEDCLCDIAVTHSPRYKIDMQLLTNNTIFQKMGIPYDKIRKLQNPIQPVVEYFRSTLKAGESLWWINGEEAENKSVPAKIRMWNTLLKIEQENLLAQGFSLFPDLFGSSQRKYERFALWLVANYGVISSSVRDPFSAGGQARLCVHGTHYDELPQKYMQLYLYRNRVKDVITSIDSRLLENTWGTKIVDNPIETWMKLVSEYAVKERFEVTAFLKDLFES